MQDFSFIVDNIETLKKKALEGDADAQNKIGVCYKLGLAGFTQSYEDAGKWYMKAAVQGFDKAQSNLAFLYLYGEGGEQDSKKAVEWFSKAAEQGNAIAQFQLAWCYSDGNGIDQDLEKAVEWFSKAAEQGHSNAQLDLGYSYEYGKGIAQNIEKAFEWYEKSALQGNAIAQANLGFFFEKGNGVERNYEKAAEWYRKSAELGNARAQNNLGHLYERGLGVDKNNKKAFELYTESANQGYGPALCNVGYCYENGIGTSKNYKKADSFYRQAAEKGNEYAKKALERIKERVKEEEFYKSISFTTRQKIKDVTYARVIPLGKNYIVKRKGLWGIVDRNNNPLLPIEYSRVHWFDGGFAGIQKNKLWGLANSNGVVTIEPQYDVLQYLSGNKACDVEIGDEEFVVDTDNNTILRVSGKKVRFSGDKLMAYSKKEMQLFNMDGTPFSKVHELICSAYMDHYDAYDNGEKTLIKKDGSEVKLPAFEIGVFQDGIAQFRYQNKYGIIDDNANIVVPNQYDYITLGDGIIAINEGAETKDNDRYFHAKPLEGKWHFWNYDFKEISPNKYDNLRQEYGKEGRMWFAERDGCWYRITPQGEFMYAETESEYKKKQVNLEKNRGRKPGWGKFSILEDVRYRGEGRKLFVRSCDGYFIRHYYFTPYLPLDSGVKWHRKIGEFFVNKYGQEMFNPHAFKMPKQKKPRHFFRLNQRLLSMSDKDLTAGFVAFIKQFGIEKNEVIGLYAIYESKRKRAILLDWLIRKCKRDKKFKLGFEELASLSVDIENWDKKRR